ncbi:HET-domain-containing protein [Stipitochalara longipes BDJ]|nr:HET-domain-containing protein [Stipitochalara longipes BDJ]
MPGGNVGPRRKPEHWSSQDVGGFIKTHGLGKHSFPTWMDTTKVQSWIEKCNEHHSHCQTKHDALNRPLWLIDVRDNCLTPANPTQRYVALSYVWGVSQDDTTPLETTKHNLVAFQEKGAFDTQDMTSRIPSTIKDVLGLVRLLGERYLWIDRFCIVQDSEEKLAQIKTMADVYACAYLTVIACGGDAYHGLRGIQGVTSERSSYDILGIPLEPENPFEARAYRRGGPSNRDLYVDTDSMRFGSTSLSHMLKLSCWSKRAWTLQERIFSQRALYIFDACVVWECHCLIWHEFQRGNAISNTTAKSHEQVFSSRLRRTRPSHRTDRNLYTSEYSQPMPNNECLNRFSSYAKGLQYSPWPDLSEYFTLVQDYCARELTFPKDALYAFTGVTETLSRVFPGGFHYGLPEMFFDVSLLWLRRKGSRCSRRVVLDAQGSTNTLPSWSWMGWQFSDGTVDLSYCMSGYSYVKPSKQLNDSPRALPPSPSIRTIPIIDWWSMSRDGGKRQVMSQYPPKDGMDIADSETLPKGWEKKGEHFIHEYDSLTAFRSPITVLDPSSSIYLDRQLDTQVLSFRTTVGNFKLSIWLAGISTEITYILDKKGERAGTLIWDDRSYTLEYGAKPITLIAIARGIKTDMQPMWIDAPEDPLGLRYYNNSRTTPEFYFVLAITIIDGIAHRLALGGIEQRVWEAEAVEVLDILLG